MQPKSGPQQGANCESGVRLHFEPDAATPSAEHGSPTTPAPIATRALPACPRQACATRQHRLVSVLPRQPLYTRCVSDHHLRRLWPEICAQGSGFDLNWCFGADVWECPSLAIPARGPENQSRRKHPNQKHTISRVKLRALSAKFRPKLRTTHPLKKRLPRQGSRWRSPTPLQFSSLEQRSAC